MPTDVFISYSKPDRAVADDVCALLERRGIACWIAPRDVAPGLVFDEAILDAIDGAHSIVVVLSRNANQSQFVKNEVNRAFSKGKAIFTLRIEDITPSKGLELYLARHQWTDGFPPPLEERLDRLANAILALQGRPSAGEASALSHGQSVLPTPKETAAAAKAEQILGDVMKDFNATVPSIGKEEKKRLLSRVRSLPHGLPPTVKVARLRALLDEEYAKWMRRADDLDGEIRAGGDAPEKVLGKVMNIAMRAQVDDVVRVLADCRRIVEAWEKSADDPTVWLPQALTEIGDLLEQSTTA